MAENLLRSAGALSGGGVPSDAKGAGSLTVFVSCDGRRVPHEVDMDATVGELVRVAAGHAGVNPSSVAVSLGGTVIQDGGASLADAGFSNEITVELVRTAWTWDKDNMHPTLRLSEDGMYVTWDQGGDSYAGRMVRSTACFASGRHYWEVVLTTWSGSGHGRDVIGICTAEQPMEAKEQHLCATGHTTTSWGVGMWQAPFRLESTSDNELRGANPKQGQSVGVLLDCDAHTVQFFLNGEEMPDAMIRDLPDKPIFPAVFLGRLSARGHVYRLRLDAETPPQPWRPPKAEPCPF